MAATVMSAVAHRQVKPQLYRGSKRRKYGRFADFIPPDGFQHDLAVASRSVARPLHF
jgi:hypothetical protein